MSEARGIAFDVGWVGVGGTKNRDCSPGVIEIYSCVAQHRAEKNLIKFTKTKKGVTLSKPKVVLALSRTPANLDSAVSETRSKHLEKTNRKLEY